MPHSIHYPFLIAVSPFLPSRFLPPWKEWSVLTPPSPPVLALAPWNLPLVPSLNSSFIHWDPQWPANRHTSSRPALTSCRHSVFTPSLSWAALPTICFLDATGDCSVPWAVRCGPLCFSPLVSSSTGPLGVQRSSLLIWDLSATRTSDSLSRTLSSNSFPHWTPWFLPSSVLPSKCLSDKWHQDSSRLLSPQSRASLCTFCTLTIPSSSRLSQYNFLWVCSSPALLKHSWCSHWPSFHLLLQDRLLSQSCVGLPASLAANSRGYSFLSALLSTSSVSVWWALSI